MAMPRARVAAVGLLGAATFAADFARCIAPRYEPEDTRRNGPALIDRRHAAEDRSEREWDAQRQRRALERRVAAVAVVAATAPRGGF